MRIGIDCHNLEGNRTGVGRYLWNLLREWSDIKDHEFFLYFKKEIPEDVRGFTPHIRNLNVGSSALFKHWVLPRAIKKDNIDVLFCPDYVLPIHVGRRTSHITIYVTRNKFRLEHPISPLFNYLLNFFCSQLFFQDNDTHPSLL